MLVDFYLLGRTPLERVLPAIAEKVLAAGQRLLVVTEEDRIAGLDAMLWGYRRDAFLPHGVAGGERAEQQPVLIAAAADPINGTANIAIADGRWREEALGFDRAFYFFDAAHLNNAREAWRELKERAGVERRYWKQDEGGRWVQGP